MSIYLPEGVDMRRADPDVPAYEAYLPTVPDPLDVTSPTSEDEAVDRVAAYLYGAKGDPGTAVLQWHACQIQIHPWTITRAAFAHLTDNLPHEYPWFEHELAHDVWHTDVALSLARKEDAS